MKKSEKKLDLKRLNSVRQKTKAKDNNWVKVGYSTCGSAAGAEEVLDVLRKETRKRSLDIAVKTCGCMGKCYAEPLVEVRIEGMPRVCYGRVDRDGALKIVEKHVCHNEDKRSYVRPCATVLSGFSSAKSLAESRFLLLNIPV